MKDETVEYKGSGRYAIPYRAYPYPPDEDGSRKWQVEYQQNPKDPYWGPRGTFLERDGKFFIGDREFPAAYMALQYRALNM